MGPIHAEPIELTPDFNKPVLEPIRKSIKDLSADGNCEFSLDGFD